jgi:hypothetical protein
VKSGKRGLLPLFTQVLAVRFPFPRLGTETGNEGHFTEEMGGNEEHGSIPFSSPD